MYNIILHIIYNIFYVCRRLYIHYIEKMYHVNHIYCIYHTKYTVYIYDIYFFNIYTFMMCIHKIIIYAYMYIYTYSVPTFRVLQIHTSKMLQFQHVLLKRRGLFNFNVDLSTSTSFSFG